MGDFTAMLSLPLLLSLAALCFYPSTISSMPPPRFSPKSKYAPRFLGKPSRSNYSAPTYQYDTRYFDQNLDHFSFSNLPKFRQRYLINTDHWAGPSRAAPILFYCGNEGDIEWFAANTGFVWEIAPRFRAMIVFPEHRYYGESMPYGSQEEAYRNTSTLAHLTAEQAIADFAVLITELKRNMSAQDCPVVLFGGSYGGMLASWMRLKYPHIAIGALAASAPILQFEDLVPPETFYQIVSDDFKSESFSCFNTIKNSWDVIEAEGQKKNGLSFLSETFRFCKKLKSTAALSDWLYSAYSYLAMADYPYPADFLMPMPGNPIKEILLLNETMGDSVLTFTWVCRRIDNCPDGTSILQQIFEGVSVYYNYTGTVDCFDLDDDPHGMDGWNWQACTEMVMPMATSKYSMFPEYSYNYTSYEEWCLGDYHVKPRPNWITTEFGGHGFKHALKTFGSNIIFSNGLLDPWSGGSVLEDISESIVAIFTKEGAHHLDLRPSTAEDPDWLVEQRATEIKIIRSWLDEYLERKRAVLDM
ncbi:lysosomal Pro-X carboxypeptidase-like isoform X3 [Salvia splendens]|uniref:lysosomal Pro-X carboxypeptidase-like isoform X3 n=1 Tax=Salvia splendens TaxID=180675 RepID=UPI001C253819|nr:lysosomal Pro-X carboxypeptidase-like isoform X3 [Salvia splendens]